jgi:hypothetical protein
MKPQHINIELGEIVKSLGYKIRKDTGNFRSNNCIIKEEKVIVLNKFATIESHNRTLAKAINQEDVVGIFIKPVIREFLDSEEK